MMPPNHALQRTRPSRRGLQSMRPVGRVAELGSLGGTTPIVKASGFSASRTLGLTISIVSTAFGLLFAAFVFWDGPGNPHAMATASALSFGLFGLPTSIVGGILLSITSWFAPMSVAQWVGTVAFILCYFIQWQYVALRCFRRARV